MGRDEITDVDGEILLLLAEVEAGMAALQVSVDQCLAITKDTTAILASRSRPSGPGG